MRQVYLILMLLMLIPFRTSARTESLPRFTFGAEWGYIGIFYSGYHYNFYAPEGYRADPRDHRFTYDSNGEAYLHAGYNFNEKYNLSLYVGVSAIHDHHHVIPMSIRLTRYFGNDSTKDRLLSFIDLGSGIDMKSHTQAILSGKIGLGYRTSLSRDTKLDFIAALRSVLTHPDINYYGTPIPHERVNRNNLYISAFSLGMSLTF